MESKREIDYDDYMEQGQKKPSRDSGDYDDYDAKPKHGDEESPYDGGEYDRGNENSNTEKETMLITQMSNIVMKKHPMKVDEGIKEIKASTMMYGGLLGLNVLMAILSGAAAITLYAN